MLKERFIAVNDLIKDGIIEIIHRSPNGQVKVNLPKMLWMQLTGEDLLRSAQGNMNRVFHRDVECTVLLETNSHVMICLNV